jgi:RND superfamily putative drug exporter
MTLVPALLTLLRERSWYIPAWLDRLLPKVTIEPPHDREAARPLDAKPAEAPARV